jgi:flagellar basal body-associated protein FliL
MATATIPTAKKSSTKPVKKDRFAVYVAFVIVALVGLFLTLYLHNRIQEKIKNTENYTALPQLTIQSDEQVVRLQMTIQVDAKDHDWLEKNKKTINEIFRNTVNEIDPETFRSNAGRVAIQKKLTETINRQMNVNKIIDVLYSDMLIQTKDEQQ